MESERRKPSYQEGPFRYGTSSVGSRLQFDATPRGERRRSGASGQCGGSKTACPHVEAIHETHRKTVEEIVMAQPKLGSGGRFRALKRKIAARGGVRNPGAVAAAIGRKKYGAKRMARMAARGRKRAARRSRR